MPQLELAVLLVLFSNAVRWLSKPHKPRSRMDRRPFRVRTLKQPSRSAGSRERIITYRQIPSAPAIMSIRPDFYHCPVVKRASIEAFVVVQAISKHMVGQIFHGSDLRPARARRQGPSVLELRAKRQPKHTRRESWLVFA